ncbi:coiled-coil domain-containing protein 172-like [Patiria miniata]|uniref:Coiled-coil domain-containing protein 172 n=1 Tax=Patiria miniata TaxID=46514 RepID=A0A914B5I8_PATMI|nr:coiled-coil domain-containing protein 172-like [Patiria miniata]
MSLNDLFVQILQSEQKAKERKTLLNEVKNEIGKVKEQIKDVQEERISTQGQLVVKTQHQTDAELSVVWLRHREVILRNQLAQVARERDASAQELKSVEAIQTEDQGDFIQEIAGFNQTHGLCGAGKKERESEARQQFRELRKQEESLLIELSDYRQTKTKTRKLQEDKKVLESEVKHLQDSLQGLHKQLDKKGAITKQLERVKSEVASKPQNDAEFLRLRSKLEVCHDEGLEAMCQALQQEVDRLQRQRWQQQLQRQANQANGTTAAAASTQQQRGNAGPKKVQKKQVQPSSLSISNQSAGPVNTWSSFRVTRPTQRTPSPQDAHQHPPQTIPGNDHHPAATSAATKPRTAFSIKKEPPFRTGGVSKPNLARLTRTAEDAKTGKPLNPAPNTKRFRFRQTFLRDQPPSATVRPNQPSSLAFSERADSHDGGCTTHGLNPPSLSSQ